MNGESWTQDSKEWERLIKRCLVRRHGTGFQEIPDEDGGDYGIEGFTSDGTAIQCYAAEEPIPRDELYTKQRDKITADIKKFIRNRNDLTAVFGPTKISTWMLVVPRFESGRLVKHGSKKTKEVLDAGLSYVTDDFKVRIATGDFLAVERADLLKSGLGEIEITTGQSSDVEPPSASFLQNLQRKLRSLNPNESHQETLNRLFLMHYVEGEEILDKLHTEFPEHYNSVVAIREAQEKFLETRALISPESRDAEGHLASTLKELEKELKKRVAGLSSSNIDSLLYGTVARWLLHCPLDFPRSNDD